ncbi:TnsA endonuclease N-terminal domain-containing protein [Mesorhizobium sp. M0276]|uniref:TnsA endonuclease N-terminal domain-containing protein n=1 Tax=Mesorhizobium sp. M0276 TaxID=2956928 RepID=UPI003335C9D5
MRRIPPSRRSHVVGFQRVENGLAHHESALERDFVTLTRFLDDGARIISQPVTIRFGAAGRRRRYTPDYFVEWSDGRSELIEIKYRADLRKDWPRLRPAFAAGRDWAFERNSRFRIATERGIRGWRLEAARRFLPLRRDPVDDVLAKEALAAVSELGTPTLAKLIAALSLSQEASTALIWRMIAHGLLRVDLSSPIRMTTRVSVA